MTRNSIITIMAAVALITSTITPTMAGGRGNSPGVGGGVAPSHTVVCTACLNRVSRYLPPNPTFPISGTTGGGSTIGTGHIKCARMPC
jgi:hypothetical protein